MSFAVKLKTESFKADRNVTGVIWLELDSHPLPDDLWYDFPVIILGWWLHNLKPVVEGRSSIAECPFMDGPYFFDITGETGSSWTVRFMRDELEGPRCLASSNVKLEEMVTAILDAARAVIDFCIGNNWHSPDLDILISECSFYENDSLFGR